MARRSAGSRRRKRATCAWASTGARSTGCLPTYSAPARCWSSATSSTRTELLTRAICAECSRATADKLFKEKKYTLNAATEIEGFLFAGKDAEQSYHETGKFEFISTGGYYHSLPLDPLRQFIDTSAEVQRAMGFQNEKDHPEVAPSQFEINYGYAEVVARRTRFSFTSC